MGKKKNKQIRNSFKGWDEMSPEDQMRNADEFFNIDKDSADDILGLGTSKKVLIDSETGLESDIVKDIINTFGTTEKEEVIAPTEEVDGIIEDDLKFDDVEIPEDVEPTESETIFDDTPNEETKDVVEEDDIELPFEEDDDDEGYVYPVNKLEPEKEEAVQEESPDEAKDADYYIDVRKFGCVVRTTLGVATFDDGIAPFAINEHVAMLEGLAKDIDTSTIDDVIIELFKKALIVNRYPAALYTKDEFLDVLGKGKFVQGDSEQAVFVDVLNEYIAVYFVYNNALDRFNDTIKSIISIEDEEEYGDPYYNVWTYLASILDSDDHSFIAEEGTVEMFYNSTHNDKEIVKEYLADKYIDSSVDDDVVVSIVGRSNVEDKFTYVMDEILDLDDDDEVVEGDETEEVPVIDDPNEAKAALAKALADNTPKKSSDDSMVIPVFHKEGNK